MRPGQMRSGRMRRDRSAREGRGQASVELALVLPVVVLVLAGLVQAVLVVRDELRVVHAARAAARAVAVSPDDAAARAAVRDSGADLTGLSLRLSGARTSGGLATVTVSARPTQVPLVGRLVSGVVLRESFSVRVE